MGDHPFTLARPHLSWSGRLGPPTKGPPEQEAQDPLVGRSAPAGFLVEVEDRRCRVNGEGGAGPVLLIQALVLEK